ncbi:MAG: DUF1926 domain-containing protein [Candidatus Omnitrophica bacterium]|nr:DUF1926 domain-containing protein [Candidatus Omnitrophota bacterium]
MITRFVLALHCHQPVGNFGWILEEAYAKAYRPFLDVLERHPKVRVVFHYSGILLDWFEKEHPEFLQRLKKLVRDNRVEVLGGGYYEPILPMVPEQDALGQMEMMRQTLGRLGLRGPEGKNEGAWLAERVWEPQLPSLLSRAGIRYTVVDDAHLALAGLQAEDRFGYYLTEDRGACVALFPSSKTLRYQVPFKPVVEVVETLRQMRSERARVVVLADDGEKFGLWPGTERWVYQEGWLEAFFQELEHSGDWLKLMTFRECLETLPPLGRVVVPPASYEEMMDWSGGFFRNFLLKYPESDTMQKKMLWVSERLKRAQSAPASKRKLPRLREAQRHLYMGQSNDATWHGVFGGLYLQHLRRGIYEHLLFSEQILDDLVEPNRAWVRAEARHVNADGEPEFLLRSKSTTLLLDLRRGGQLLEFSDKTNGVNLLDTLTRRPEAYHKKLQALHPVPVAQAQPSGPLSIHERAPANAADLADSLVYDPYRRAGLIDHILSPDAQVHPFSCGAVEELGDFLAGPYEGRLKLSKNSAQAVLTRKGRLRVNGVDLPLGLRKTITLSAKDRAVSIAYQLDNGSAEPLNVLFGSELNLGLKDAHVNRIGQTQGIRRFAVVDPALHLQVSWTFNRPARLWYFPLETVSDSERGMERTYQGVSLTFLWPVRLGPAKSWRVAWTLEMESKDAC